MRIASPGARPVEIFGKPRDPPKIIVRYAQAADRHPQAAHKQPDPLERTYELALWFGGLVSEGQVADFAILKMDEALTE